MPATMPILHQFEDIPAHEVIELGREYVHPTFGGEAICSMGKCVDFASKKISGIINAVPFNCMPGITVVSLSNAFKRDYKIPYLNIDYDGFVDSSRDARIVAFMNQINQRSKTN